MSSYSEDYDDVIRARCSSALRADLRKVAAAEGDTEAQLLRKIVADYVRNYREQGATPAPVTLTLPNGTQVSGSKDDIVGVLKETDQMQRLNETLKKVKPSGPRITPKPNPNLGLVVTDPKGTAETYKIDGVIYTVMDAADLLKSKSLPGTVLYSDAPKPVGSK